MKLYDLEKELAYIYKFSNYDDYCLNGIQVEGKNEIKKIVLSVNISSYVIDFAIRQNADAIIVHHGFFGKSFLSLRGNIKDRIKKLLENNISLIGIHLPMDAHEEFGHNKILADLISLDNLKQFYYGFFGKNNKNFTIDEITKSYENYLRKNLKGNLNSIQKYNFLRKDFVDNIVIISGESSKYFEDACLLGADLFICGSISQHLPEIAEECQKAILALGHYNSEIPGVVALSNLLNQKYNLETINIFINNNL